MTTGVVETHSSTLFFVDDRVYKRKRPLDLGFSDFRTREARRAGCQAEVDLNRRLAPDVYLGVADVVGPDGVPCDHLVVMRRMPDERRLASLVLAGADVDAALRDIARQLADLHRRSPAPDDLRELGRAAAQERLWTEGLDAMRGVEDLVPESVRERTRELAARWLAGRGALLDARVAEGRVHDGHGDLLADDIFVLDDGPRVLDCLEFDQRLRVCDGLSDAAFLAMDLERLGAPAAARAFLDAYEQAADDAPPRSLEHLYLAYRAHVRSKVTCIRARQDPGAEVAELARRLADQALGHLERGRVRLVLVGGLPGSGKTTVAAALAVHPGWVHLSSDVTRKRLAGLQPDQPAADAYRTGLYDEGSTDRTYHALLSDARSALQGGQSVVLDASFVDAGWRERARELARETTSDLVELRCCAPDALADSRILERRPGASDATPAVRLALAADADPWPESTGLDTSGPVAATVRAAAALVGLEVPRA